MPDPSPPSQPFRIGHGYDIHRLAPGGRLLLGGIVVAEDIGPIAHSDGDVVIHAVVDALLGAMGWGDIGQRFPDTDPRWKGAPSRIFLETVFREVCRAGYALANLDLTVLAERPRLSDFRQQIVQNLRQVLHGPVNIKAGTHEQCDAVGQGQAIACHAVVLLQAASQLESGQDEPSSL